jgi:hypothetical protein
MAGKKKLYRFEPTGMDAWDKRPHHPPAGTVVQKTQPPGTPRNGTMGHSFVENAATGEFHGLVSNASLKPHDSTKGAGGWPMVDHPINKGEKTMACPSCASTRVVTERGTAPSGKDTNWKLASRNRCTNCGHSEVY